MRHSTLFGVLFVGVTALGGIACSNSGSTDSTGESQSEIRSVRGHLKSGTVATEVVALVAQAEAQAAKTYSAPVDAQGDFRLTLPKGPRYVLVLRDGDKGIADLRFASSAGGALTSLLPIANPPVRMLRPQSTDEAEDDIDLGEVDVDENECVSEGNPLDQVDSDSDGTSDYEDADDDDDGRADVDDEDDDADGVADHDEDHDEDDDGASNDVDDDDDDDGVMDEHDDDHRDEGEGGHEGEGEGGGHP
ncbi:hypothetical protein WME79_47020 [Sorangium sp. So ce726]|uniref:hypothetical protein n=1 Tax=Sorangium sp. So ce726 TaxID=3133319 RepID=UPI003F5DAB64